MIVRTPAPVNLRVAYQAVILLVLLLAVGRTAAQNQVTAAPAEGGPAAPDSTASILAQRLLEAQNAATKAELDRDEATPKDLPDRERKAAQARLLVTQLSAEIAAGELVGARTKEFGAKSAEAVVVTALGKARSDIAGARAAGGDVLYKAEQARLIKVRELQVARRNAQDARAQRITVESNSLALNDALVHQQRALLLNADEPCPADPTPIDTLAGADPRDADMLTIIFNRRTNHLWVHDPGNKGMPRYRLVSSFGYLPPARSNEPVLLLICGIHFGGATTVTPTLLNLPDVRTALYSGPTGTSSPDTGTPAKVPADSSKKTSIADLFEQSHLAAYMSPLSVTASTTCDEEYQRRIRDLIKAVNASITAYNTALTAFVNSDDWRAFHRLSSGAGSTGSLMRQLDEIAQEERSASLSVGAFHDTGNDIDAATSRAGNIATNLIAAAAGDSWKTFKSAATDFDAKVTTYRTERDKDPSANNCSPLAAEISEADDHIGDTYQSMVEASQPAEAVLADLIVSYDRIGQLYGSLNADYKLSSTMDKHMVEFSSTNTLITEQINIADDWKPYPGPTIAALPPGDFSSAPAKTDAARLDPAKTNVAKTETAKPKPGTTQPDPTKPASAMSTPQPATAVITTGTGATATTVTLNLPNAPTPTTQTITQTNTPTPATAPAKTKTDKTSKPAGADTQSADTGTKLSADAQPSLWRKLVVNFVATGGAFAAHEPTTSFLSQQFPTAVTTVTSTTTTVTTAAGVSTTSVDNSTANATSTEYLPVNAGTTSWHPGAVAGITWFPWGMDTFSYASRNYSAIRRRVAPIRNLGFFLGSTVNTSGTFTFGPAYQLQPGIELLVGGTLLQTDSLNLGIVPCVGIGSSLTSGPTVTSTKSTNDVDPTTGTRTFTTSTMGVTTQSHCANSTATVLIDSTIPKHTDTRVGFTIGILLNSNLFKAFSFK